MFEGPNLFGQEDQDESQEQPFDYVEHAKKLREEREALEKQKKAEKEAKDAEKKAEKDARLAKKIAEKATEKLEKKADKLGEKSENAKVEIADAKEGVNELTNALEESIAQSIEQSESELPAPVEMAFTNGSEYIANLEDGEEAIFDLNQTIDKVEESVTLADEVQAQADALARAREALHAVDAEDMGATFEGQDDNSVVFGETGPQDDIRSRLRHAWELPTAANVDAPEQNSSSIDSYVANESSYNPLDEAVASAQRPADATPIHQPRSVADESRHESRSSNIRSSASFVGGVFASRAKSIKRRLERTDAIITSETADVQREMQMLQPLPQATRESIQVSTPEIRGSNEPAIPDWIKQVESDLRKGRVPELKKWQYDVLRAQHPDLIKRYEKLDQDSKREIRTQSSESLRGSNMSLNGKPASSPLPGELPSPVFSMPAYMTPSTPRTPMQPVPAYEYAMNESSTRNGSIFSNEYLTIVVVGGLLFGSALIVAFGF